jgi:hypothetical protein
MDEITCLQQFLYFCQNRYGEKALGALEKSCCPQVKVLVIDFDDVTKQFCKKLGFSPYSSCDALKIFPTKNAIHFIEMKGFIKGFQNQKNFMTYIDHQIKSILDSFQNKIENTVTVYDLLLQEFVTQKSITKAQKENCQKCEKQFILLTDLRDLYDQLSPIQRLSFDMKLLSLINKLPTQITSLSPIEKVFLNQQPNTLMFCQNTDNYYSQFHSSS